MIFTFDPYYSPNVSNQFMEDFKNNGGKYRTYIQAQPPYQWYYEVKDTDIPKFLKFKEADSFALRTILPKLKAFTPNEQLYLKRIPRTPADFERYVSPIVFKKARTANYFCVFRFKNIAELISISSTLGIKIYFFPKRIKNLNIACTFNKFIKNFVFQHNILLEKTSKTQFSKPGEIELFLNNKKFVTDKIMFKSINLPYVDDGTYKPLPYNKPIA